MKNTEDKKVKEVAALKYSPDKNKAPQIIALGRGEAAEKILEKARENDVPVYEDKELAHTLNKFSIGEEIPQELYDVVAEILIFVSNLDRSFGDKYGIKKQK